MYVLLPTLHIRVPYPSEYGTLQGPLIKSPDPAMNPNVSVFELALAGSASKLKGYEKRRIGL